MERFPACVASVRELGVTKADEKSDPTSRQEIFQELNQRLGILSLSEVPDSFLMWCRYASGDTGFVYEFDDKHPWFWAKAEEKDDTNELRKVSYVDIPASPYLSELSAHEVLYSKRKGWECEREWRIIRPFLESTPRKGEDVYLFDIPPAALTGVIVGSLTTDESIDQLALIVGSNSNLAHLRFGFADHLPCEEHVDIFWGESLAQLQVKGQAT